MTETTIMKSVQLAFSKLGHRLFRNNVGVAWQGECFRLKNGDILLKNPRPVTFGLTVGSGDLIGFVRKTITPLDVGTQLLIFTNIEIKSKNGRLTKEQIAFDDFIKSNGGLSMVIKELPLGGTIENAIHSFRGLEKTNGIKIRND